jgi:hypothetical protein
MSVDASSFRDPFGCIFFHKEKVYRSIFSPGLPDFEAASKAGIYEKLIDAGLLIEHKEVYAPKRAPQKTALCLEHPKIPMVSYPWEWPFSFLKEAALIHLEAMEFLIPKGFWLRDASAFNIQYDGERLRLIDTLSIGRRAPDSPWVAYGQFCSHFLAPLALAAFRDIRLLSLWRNYIDGIPLDLASNLIPLKKRYSPGLYMHLNLHAKFQAASEKRSDKKSEKPNRKPKVNDRGLIGLIRSLRRTVQKINWGRTSKIWENYSEIRTYEQSDIKQKAEYVTKAIKHTNPKIVWDLGGNTGEYSKLAAENGAYTVSIDGDPACTEHIYQIICKERGVRSLLPLTMDLANPSPGLGWDGVERSNLMNRSQADLVLALALIHHLVLSSCIPLTKIAQWLACMGDRLLVEYIPQSDPMVQRLLANRNDVHLPYNRKAFQDGFGRYFQFLDELSLTNGRTLFICQKKNDI